MERTHEQPIFTKNSQRLTPSAHALSLAALMIALSACTGLVNRQSISKMTDLQMSAKLTGSSVDLGDEAQVFSAGKPVILAISFVDDPKYPVKFGECTLESVDADSDNPAFLDSNTPCATAKSLASAEVPGTAPSFTDGIQATKRSITFQWVPPLYYVGSYKLTVTLRHGINLISESRTLKLLPPAPSIMVGQELNFAAWYNADVSRAMAYDKTSTPFRNFGKENWVSTPGGAPSFTAASALGQASHFAVDGTRSGLSIFLPERPARISSVSVDFTAHSNVADRTLATLHDFYDWPLSLVLKSSNKVQWQLHEDYEDVVMAQTPLQYWPLNESSGATQFANLVPGGLPANILNASACGLQSEASMTFSTTKGIKFNRNDTDNMLSCMGRTATPPDLGGATEFSFSAWVKSTDIRSGSYRPHQTLFMGDDAYGSVWRVVLIDGYQLRWDTNGSNNAWNGAPHYGIAIPVGQWNHLAVSSNYTTGKSTFYVNGVSQGTFSFDAGHTVEPATGFSIGQGYGGGASGFSNASLAHLAFFKHTLSADDVKMQYLAGRGSLEAQLTATPTLPLSATSTRINGNADVQMSLMPHPSFSALTLAKVYSATAPLRRPRIVLAKDSSLSGDYADLDVREILVTHSPSSNPQMVDAYADALAVKNSFVNYLRSRADLLLDLNVGVHLLYDPASNWRGTHGYGCGPAADWINPSVSYAGSARWSSSLLAFRNDCSTLAPTAGLLSEGSVKFLRALPRDKVDYFYLSFSDNRYNPAMPAASKGSLMAIATRTGTATAESVLTQVARYSDNYESFMRLIREPNGALRLDTDVLDYNSGNNFSNYFAVTSHLPGGYTLSADKWHHIAVRDRVADADIYIDGRLAFSAVANNADFITAVANDWWSGQDLQMGGYSASGAQSDLSYLDLGNAALFAPDLSPSQIKSLCIGQKARYSDLRCE